MNRWYLYILLFLIAASYFGCHKASRWKGGYYVEGFTSYSFYPTQSGTTGRVSDTLLVYEEDDQDIRIEINSLSITLSYSGKDLTKFSYKGSDEGGHVQATCDFLRPEGTIHFELKRYGLAYGSTYNVSGCRIFK